ncbi:MAG: tetratricopeptide repeat-containing sulfotransferase family protein [Caulobacteraceae bacterium]
MSTGDPPAAQGAATRSEVLESVFAALGDGDMAEARRLSVCALAGGIEHPVLLNLRSLDFEEAGRFNDALRDLRRAHVLAPTDPTILNACGLCLMRMERWEEARRCYDQALALKPDFGQAWFNRGYVLERVGETGEAAGSYAKAAEIHPQNVQAWANAATLAARRGSADKTRLYANRALALQPGHPTAVLALTAIEKDDLEDAERRLRSLLKQELGDFDRAIAFGQLGDVLDARDQAPDAFDAYAAGNRIFRAALAPRFAAPGMETVPDVLRWLNLWAEIFERSNWVVDPDQTTEAEGVRGHVFLTGFPRSGTTLMESFLANHPDVVSLEERDTLRQAILAFLGGSRGLTRLAGATGPELRSLREDYWARVRSFGVEPTGKIFIDKNPFNTLKLPLIKKLFPGAKIIFAQRDPREVVLSCFRRRFNFNASTFVFLDLRAAAENYDGTMRLAQLLRDKLGFDEFVLVYEKLIADFPNVARAACEFIGVEWRAEYADFAGRARRGEVASASSAQIARGLYTEGTAHWRRYRAQMAPVLPILAPWVEKFGYPAD